MPHPDLLALATPWPWFIYPTLFVEGLIVYVVGLWLWIERGYRSGAVIAAIMVIVGVYFAAWLILAAARPAAPYSCRQVSDTVTVCS